MPVSLDNNASLVDLDSLELFIGRCMARSSVLLLSVETFKV